MAFSGHPANGIDVPGQLRVVLLGEDQQLHGDVLAVEPIQKQVAEHIIYRRVKAILGDEEEHLQEIEDFLCDVGYHGSCGCDCCGSASCDCEPACPCDPSEEPSVSDKFDIGLEL